MKRYILLFISLSFLSTYSQDASEIVKKADRKMRGNSSYSEIIIKIIRPNWQKEMHMKMWTKGDDYSVSLITYPPKEKGIVFLKRKNELWNYVPSIEKRIKLPPSMMMQSWMGTDMTNDDLVKQSSISKDYSHKIIGEEIVEGLPAWKIMLTPKENAAVVWGKILVWIDKKDYMQLKAEFYDEDNFLVNKMLASDPQIFDGRKLPSKIAFVPVDKPGNKTLIIYKKLLFDLPIPDKYFTLNYMKRLR